MKYSPTRATFTTHCLRIERQDELKQLKKAKHNHIPTLIFISKWNINADYVSQVTMLRAFLKTSTCYSF